MEREGEVCSCHTTTNMPSKSLPVSKYTQVVTNTQPGCFSFNKHLRYSNATDQPGCIEADRLSGSYFQIYFHDKHLFQTHHVPLRLSASHVIPGKAISVTACIDTNKASWQWALIILWNIRTRFLLWVRNQSSGTSSVSSFHARNGKKQKMWNHDSIVSGGRNKVQSTLHHLCVTLKQCH